MIVGIINRISQSYSVIDIESLISNIMNMQLFVLYMVRIVVCLRRKLEKVHFHFLAIKLNICEFSRIKIIVKISTIAILQFNHLNTICTQYLLNIEIIKELCKTKENQNQINPYLWLSLQHPNTEMKNIHLKHLGTVH